MHEAVVHHLQNRAADGLRVGHGQAQHNEAHVRNRAVGHQALDILLFQGHQGTVDDADQGEHDQQGCIAGEGLGEEWHDQAQQAVGTHLEQDPGQDDGAGRRCLDMGVGQPGVERKQRDLDRKGQGKRQEAQYLERGSGGGRQRCGNLGNGEGSGLDEDGHNRDQHQGRTQQRVHDELQGGVDPVSRCPTAQLGKYIGISVNSKKV